MEKLTALELIALIAYHVKHDYGINADRILELAEALKVAQRREASGPRVVA